VPGGKHLAAYSRIETLTIPSNVHQKPVLAARKVNLAHHPFSIFSHSPFLQFSQTTKLLLSFLPLQICVNPRLSAAKKSFPFFYFFVFPAFFVFLISNR